MDFLEDQEKILILGKLISDKDIVFELVLSKFKEITSKFETNFNEYEDFKQTLRSDYECSDECLDFYQYCFEFENNNPTNFKKVYQCAIVNFKLQKKNNEPLLSDFKSCLEISHSKNQVEENGDEVVIGDISLSNEKKLANKSVGDNNIDNIFWDFDRFLYGRD